ncbi:MAG: hypothetical protein M0006_08475 [Magnetospirillum sp.]|nr:hypothetical protein [Magnetospirillum sp.]
MKMIGFDFGEQDVIRGMIDRFSADGHQLDELTCIRKAEMPGYNGKVVPRPAPDGDGFAVTMYLSCCAPFTVAHELAHIADIRARRQETRDHLSWRMPNHWHLAHRMSSEYTANRLACAYVDEAGVFAAFRSDHVGLLTAIRNRDWASLLVYYALILGLFHGLGRYDSDPARLIPPGEELADGVLAGMRRFGTEASSLFDSLWKRPALVPA